MAWAKSPSRGPKCQPKQHNNKAENHTEYAI